MNGMSSTAPQSPCVPRRFRKIQLTDEFWTEAPALGDIDCDGHLDVVAGPYWYAGPDFKVRHAYCPATQTFTRKTSEGTLETLAGFEGALGSGQSAGETESIFTKVVDLNGDGWPDILVVGQAPNLSSSKSPSRILTWYENPGKNVASAGHWKRHLVAEGVDNSSVDFVDLFDNGQPVLICMHDGCVGYFKANPTDPAIPWTFHAISRQEAEFTWYTHGLGCGDLNGDGRKDILHSDGWWEQPESVENDPVWEYHPFPFNLGPAQIKQSWYRSASDSAKTAVLFDVTSDGVPQIVTIYGGSQMIVADVNGDGFPDVVTSIAAHGYGLVWWEQLQHRERLNAVHALGDPTGIEFRRHIIINKDAGENRYGVNFSEMQAVALADIDGDGLSDIVTGKRFWCHGDGTKMIMDPESDGHAVLYWFKQVRNPDNTVEFVPYLIDDDSGAGAQIAIGDVNGDGRPDIVVANKKGTFVFIQDGENSCLSPRVTESLQPRTGSLSSRSLPVPDIDSWRTPSICSSSAEDL
jgi:FG-GAP repeat